MNKKLINEDIANMKFLFGYKPGRVISEQDYDYTTDDYLDTKDSELDEVEVDDKFEGVDLDDLGFDDDTNEDSGFDFDTEDKEDEFMDYDGDDASTWPGANYGDDEDEIDDFEENPPHRFR